MAYAKATLADLKQSLADKHESGVLPTDTATLSYWTRLLNDAQNYCAQKLRLEKSTTLTTSSGTVALPADFIFPVKVVNDEDYEYTQVPLISSPGLDGAYYWISGNQTDGFFLNSPEDDTFTVYYAFRPAPLVNNTDVCVIPDPEAVVLRAYGKLRLAETDPLDDAQASLDEAEMLLKELISQSNLNDQHLGFSIQEGA